MKSFFKVLAPFTLATLFALAMAVTAVAAEYRPVICVGALIGAFEDGQWQAAPTSVTVDGKTVVLATVSKDVKLMERLENEEVACETPLLKAGQKLVFYTPQGRDGEAVVTRTYIWYEGEASGAAALGMDMDSYDADWSNLIVGVADGVNALPAPTVRTTEGQGVVFSCDYQNQKYSLAWTPSGDSFAAKLSQGEKSWDLKGDNQNSPGPSPMSVEDIRCGFFDLDGDGTLELVVYDSGISGSVSLFQLNPESGPQIFAWDYTGEE